MLTKVNWKWPNNDKLKVHTVYGSACTNLVLVAVSNWLTEGARSEERLFFLAPKNKVWFSSDGDFKGLEASLSTRVVFVYNQSALIAAVSEP